MYGKDTCVHEFTTEVSEQTVAVNLRGPWLCAKYVIPHMLKQQRDASSTSLRPRD
jgi:NAD(P)-dependent dehydrogenase (short-subunit alcohol dehydrogenase family)